MRDYEIQVLMEHYKIENFEVEVVGKSFHIYKCTYKDVEFEMFDTGWYGTTYYGVSVNGKTLATRCRFGTALGKATRYIDNL